MSTGFSNRGKTAEALVRARLQVVCSSKEKAWHRFPDARAGSRQPTLADFMVSVSGRVTLIEVKETKHQYRLPHGNFSPDQVARMRMWKWAGVSTLVLVYHSEVGKWRAFDIEYFIQREGGSWDLRAVPFEELEDIL